MEYAAVTGRFLHWSIVFWSSAGFCLGNISSASLNAQEGAAALRLTPGSMAWLQQMDHSLRVFDDALQEGRCLFKCSACCCRRPQRVSETDIRRMHEFRTLLSADPELALMPYPVQTSVNQAEQCTLLEACVEMRRTRLFKLMLRCGVNPFDVERVGNLIYLAQNMPEIHLTLLEYADQVHHARPRTTDLLDEQLPFDLRVLTESFAGPNPAHYFRDFRHEGKTLLDLELEQGLLGCSDRPSFDDMEHMHIIRNLIGLGVGFERADRLHNLQRSACGRVRCETIVLSTTLVMAALGYYVAWPGLLAALNGLLGTCLEPFYQAVRFARAAQRARLLEEPVSGPEAV